MFAIAFDLVVADTKTHHPSVLPRSIWNIKPRLFTHDVVTNPRNSGAIAVVCA
jgi:virulence-associated protein VapD